MDDIVATLVGGAIGEELFRKLAKKRFFPFYLLVAQIIIFELIFMLLTILLYIGDLYSGRDYWVSMKKFAVDFFRVHFVWTQPWALMLCSFLATLGTLSYMWHRRQMTK